MAEFIVKKSKKVDIKNEAGEVLVSYNIDVGNHESLKMWMSKIKDVDEIVKKMGSEESVIDDLVSLEREIIQMITNDFDNLWSICGENVFMMLKLVRFFSDYIKEEIEAVTKEYL